MRQVSLNYLHPFWRQVRKRRPKCLFDHIWSRCDLDLWTFDLKT